jgi:hypothetical protein
MDKFAKNFTTDERIRRCLRGDRDIILTSRAQEGNLQKTSSFKLVFSHTWCWRM